MVNFVLFDRGRWIYCEVCLWFETVSHKIFRVFDNFWFICKAFFHVFFQMFCSFSRYFVISWYFDIWLFSSRMYVVIDSRCLYRVSLGLLDVCPNKISNGVDAWVFCLSSYCSQLPHSVKNWGAVCLDLQYYVSWWFQDVLSEMYQQIH